MKPWLRLTIITITVGGGFAGLLSTISALSSWTGTLDFLLKILGFALFAYVFVCGLMFANDANRTDPLFLAFAIQIPWVSTPLIVYQFAPGIHTALGLTSSNEAGKLSFGLGWNFLLGSEWRLGLMHDRPWNLSVNLVALAICWLLSKQREGSKGRLKASTTSTV